MDEYAVLTVALKWPSAIPSIAASLAGLHFAAFNDGCNLWDVSNCAALGR